MFQLPRLCAGGLGRCAHVTCTLCAAGRVLSEIMVQKRDGTAENNSERDCFGGGMAQLYWNERAKITFFWLPTGLQRNKMTKTIAVMSDRTASFSLKRCKKIQPEEIQFTASIDLLFALPLNHGLLFPTSGHVRGSTSLSALPPVFSSVPRPLNQRSVTHFLHPPHLPTTAVASSDQTTRVFPDERESLFCMACEPHVFEFAF